MADIHIKESDALRQYANKLISFRNGVCATGVVVGVQSHKKEKELEDKKYEIKRLCDIGEGYKQGLVSHYKYVIEQCSGDARSVIGESDLEIRDAYKTLQNDVDEYRRLMSRMQVILEQVRERTKNFALQTCEITNRSVVMLRKKADSVDDYKQVK